MNINNQSIHRATLRERLSPFLSGFIFFVPAVILALVGGGIGIESITEQWRLQHWSKTAAIVEESQCVQQPSGKYKVSIRYRYSFNGNEFHSKRYEPFNSNKLSDSKKANDFVSKYAAGNIVTAYVDPAHPRHAFLNASMNSGLIACIGIVFFLTGLYLTGYTIYLMQRSLSAFCIVRFNRRFYFYNSLAAAQKASQWAPIPKGTLKPSQFNERIIPWLGGLLFAAIGIAGIIVLIMLHSSLPGIVMVVGSILMPAFTIMGIGIMWRAASAKYVLARKGPYNQEEIFFLDSQDVPPP